MTLLSFSIDLSRSTEIKTHINQVCRTKEQRHKLLLQYHRILTNIESDFYFHALHNKIPLERLFLVKSIGDELWYVYLPDEQPEERFKAEVLRLLFVLAHAASRHRELFICEREVAWEEEERNSDVWDDVPHERMACPCKVYADMLHDCEDLTQERFEAVWKRLYGDLQGHAKTEEAEHDLNGPALREQLKKAMPGIAYNLGLGQWEASGEKFTVTGLRFDPIGADVDLFFRCAEKAIPSLLRIGQNLFDLLRNGGDVVGNRLMVECREGSNARYEHLDYAVETLSADELKGIEREYRIYTLAVYSPNLVVKPNEPSDGRRAAREHFLQHGLIHLSEDQAALRDSGKPYHFSINKDLWKKHYPS